jgi:Fur family transcriptional regulator, ferric uptake regulator
MAGPDAVERTLAAIRRRGGRVTDQRRAILTVLFEQDDHVSVDDLVGRVHDRLPDVHVSTVYRFLETLESMHLATHVHLGHEAAMWHLSEHHRAHVVCAGCGKVASVDPALLAQWSSDLLDSIGFALAEQHFALAGLCRECA